MAGKTLAGPVIGITATHPAGGTGTGAQGPVGPRVRPAHRVHPEPRHPDTGHCRGTPGTPGLPGPDATPNYAYVYDTGGQTVAIEADVAFPTTGPLLGFTHLTGSTDLVVTTGGVYRVEFSLAGVEPNQFAIMVNGIALPGMTYGSGAGTQAERW